MADVVQIKSAEQIQDDFLNALAALLGINDRNLGSDIRTLAYAYGLELDELFYQLLQGTRASLIRYSTGFQLEEIGADYGLSRKGSRAALVPVTFNGVNATSIPIGSLVSKPATTTQEEIVYETLEAGTISGGSTTLACRCQTEGEIGNVGIGEIDNQFSSISGVTSVTNPGKARQGREEESDDDFRDRIRRSWDEKARATLPAMRAGILNFEQQQVTLATSIDASDTRIYVFEDLQEYTFAETGKLLIGDEVIEYTGYSVVPDVATNNAFPYFFGLTRGADSTTATDHSIDDDVLENIATSAQSKIETVKLVETPCQVDAYIAFRTTEVPDPTLLEVLKKRIEGDASPYNPGYRAAGTVFNLYAATIQTVDVEVSIEVEPDYVSESVAISNSVKDAIETFINSGDIGEGVIGWGLAAALDIEGVRRVIFLEIDGNRYDGENAADVVINSTSVTRTSAANITVTT